MPLCNHRIFSEQLFQFYARKRIGGKVKVQYSSKALLKQLFRKYPMITSRRNETHSTSLCHYDLICLDEDVRHSDAVALRHDLSQEISFLQYKLICPDSEFWHRRSEATGTCLCNKIRFVLLLTTKKQLLTTES